MKKSSVTIAVLIAGFLAWTVLVTGCNSKKTEQQEQKEEGHENHDKMDSMATIYADGGIYKPNKIASLLSATENVIDDAGVIALNKIATPYSNTITGLPQTNDGLVEKTNIEVIIVPNQPGITKAENNVIESNSKCGRILSYSFTIALFKRIFFGRPAGKTKPQARAF